MGRKHNNNTPEKWKILWFLIKRYVTTVSTYLAINKINAALIRIEDGSYGYCEETGEPIGVKRLIARPIATLTIEAQEKHEKNEKIFANI